MLTKYGLKCRSSNRLLGVSARANKPGECVDVTYILEDSEHVPVWLASTYEIAEKARTHDTPWYNADYNSPISKLDPHDLKVVRVIICVEEDV